MSRTRLALVSLVAAGLLAACGDDADTNAGTAPTTPAPTTVAPTTATPTMSMPTTPSVTPSTAPIADNVVAVSVAGGKVTTNSARVKITKGSTVALVVTSDVADEIHLHGYDKSADVAAGGTATLKFTADTAGVFEVELEERALRLLQLQVQ